MAYTKQTWATGDVITAEKLNHMEGGIETATPLEVLFTLDFVDDAAVITCSMTFSELINAVCVEGSNTCKPIIARLIMANTPSEVMTATQYNIYTDSQGDLAMFYFTGVVSESVSDALFNVAKIYNSGDGWQAGLYSYQLTGQQ